MKTRTFNPGSNRSPLHLTREGATVNVYSDTKSEFRRESSQTFPTVTAAKAFMSKPSV